MKSYQKGIGYRYLLKTKYYPDRPFIDDLGRIESPPLYKVYPEAPRIALPKQFDFTLPEFTSIIASRRSHRHFKPASLLCQNWPSCSGRAKVLPRLKVTALPPRLGPLYPVETYLSVHRVQDVPAGIYHFNVRDFCLERLVKGDFAPVLGAMALGQSVIKRAAVVFIWTAVILRSMAKYRNRAIRYIFLDAGHICQNLLLAVTALNLGACPVGAFLTKK